MFYDYLPFLVLLLKKFWSSLIGSYFHLLSFLCAKINSLPNSLKNRKTSEYAFKDISMLSMPCS